MLADNFVFVGSPVRIVPTVALPDQINVPPRLVGATHRFGGGGGGGGGFRPVGRGVGSFAITRRPPAGRP